MDSARLSLKVERCLDAVVITMFWTIWFLGIVCCLRKLNHLRQRFDILFNPNPSFGLALDGPSLELSGLMGVKNRLLKSFNVLLVLAFASCNV